MPETARMNEALAVKYGVNVPRYTSYPTAPHFSRAVSEGVYRNWLAALRPEQPLSLYFHIPYCREMCWFCGCHTKATRRYAPVGEYLDILLREIDLVSAAAPGPMRAAHAHWGGGSPSMLSAEDWLRMVAHVRSRFVFDEESELAVEIDPRTASTDYIAALGESGVTRVSIGVQDFREEVQRAINRIQPYAMTAKVVEEVRAAGIKSVNLDLMYGLPHQTVDSVLEQVDLAHGLAPDRIALFGYAHVPWMKTHQRLIDEAALPGLGERFEQSQAAAMRLRALGYVAIGFDHFARREDGLAQALVEGTLQRNFQGYTSDDADVLIGFGASAIGQLPKGYVQNEPAIGRYMEEVKEGRLPVVRGAVLSSEDRVRRDIINELMCHMEANIAPVSSPDTVEMLAPLVEDGLVVRQGTFIRITEKGRPFVRIVASLFDAYLHNGEEVRHSKAV